MWPDRRLLDLLRIEHPIIQAPMAGASGADLAAAVSGAGGLGSVGSAAMSEEAIRTAVRTIRSRTDRPFNLNFFCAPAATTARLDAWLERLGPFFAELGLPTPVASALPDVTRSFTEATCTLVEELAPPVVSFHFGLPEPALLDRVRATGAVVLSTANSVAAARALAAAGADVIIAQGSEAGGHQGDPDPAAEPIGTMALVPAVVDAVDVPVIAAGGIGDGRGIAAALMLGAAAAQLGTAYLFTPEAAIGPLYRAALRAGDGGDTRITNVLSGRPARSLRNRLIDTLGPRNPSAPDFPLGVAPLLPLRAAAEPAGRSDFSALWSGQAVALGREIPAAELTRELAETALRLLGRA